MAGRLSQLPIEVVTSGDAANARVSQLAIEAVTSGDGNNVRLSQLAVEVITLGENSQALFSQLAIECVMQGNEILVYGTGGIPSGEAFGATGASVTQGSLDQDLTGVSGIPSGEAFGSNGMLGNIFGAAGIPSAEAFGSNGILGNVFGLAGIPSGEAFGVGGAVAGPLTGVTGIPSAEAFGDGSSVPAGVSLVLESGVSGIPSGEAFGVGGSLSNVMAGLYGRSFGFRLGVGGSVVDLNLTSASNFKFFIKGRDMTAYVKPNTLRGNRDINFTSAGSLTMCDQRNIPGTEPRAASPLRQSTLTVSAGPSATSMTLASGSGFPTQDVLLRVQYSTSFEYVWLVSRSGDVLTVRRAEYGTTAATWGVGSSVTVQSIPAAYIPPIPFTPLVGMPIEIYYYDRADAGLTHRTLRYWKIFGGSFAKVTTKKAHATFYEREWDCSLVDWAFALRKRVVKKDFPVATFPTLSSIMNWLDANYFVAEGLTYIPVAPDVTMAGDLSFPGDTLDNVLGKLQELTGLNLVVDFDRNLRLVDYPAEVQDCPFDLVEDTTGPNAELWRDLEVTEDLGLYRNVQITNASYTVQSQTITVSYTCPMNEQVTDGYPFQRYWDVYDFGGGLMRAPFFADHTYNGKVGKLLKVKYNGAEVPFWVQFAESEPANWKWLQISPTDLQLIWNVLSDPTAATYPATGATLELTFELGAATPQPITVENSAEIAARKEIEVYGTGRHEVLTQLENVEDPDIVVQYAQAALARYGVMGRGAVFGTDVMGFEVGQRLNTYLPSWGVTPAQNFTVEGLSFEEKDAKFISWGVTATNAIQQRDALAALDRLMKRLKRAEKAVIDVVTWDAARSNPPYTNPGLVIGTAVGNPYVIRKKVSLRDLVVLAKTAPTGADVKFQIKRNGVAIFDSSNIVYPAGTTTVKVYQNWVGSSAPVLYENDIMTLDVIQVGSNNPGADFVLHLRGYA